MNELFFLRSGFHVAAQTLMHFQSRMVSFPGKNEKHPHPKNNEDEEKEERECGPAHRVTKQSYDAAPAYSITFRSGFPDGPNFIIEIHRTGFTGMPSS